MSHSERRCTAMTQLDQLKRYTTIVANTGNCRELAQFAPRDATTNPSLSLKAVQQPAYAPLLADTVAAHRREPLDAVVDQVLGDDRRRDPRLRELARHVEARGDQRALDRVEQIEALG